MKSHPDWKRLNQVVNDLAIATNEKVKDSLAKHFEGGRFVPRMYANFLSHSQQFAATVLLQSVGQGHRLSLD
jgi:hypothetical protein